MGLGERRTEPVVEREIFLKQEEKEKEKGKAPSIGTHTQSQSANILSARRKPLLWREKV